jgi:hypothetical protein
MEKTKQKITIRADLLAFMHYSLKKGYTGHGTPGQAEGNSSPSIVPENVEYC